jgi:hypothetical protein
MLMGNHIIIECEGEHAHLSRSALEYVMQRAAQVAGATVYLLIFIILELGWVSQVYSFLLSLTSLSILGQNITTPLLIFLCVVNVMWKKPKSPLLMARRPTPLKAKILLAVCH